jgi:hypothetical protein
MINFNTLVTIDEQLNYVPKLAESWEMQDNGKVYVFRLREGVKFHDGNDFDADAGGMQPAELGGPALHIAHHGADHRHDIAFQAARDSVQGYVYERGLKIGFERTWLDKPQG